MKWRILLELTEITGSVRTREMITGDQPTNVISPESIGLSLAESKSILAAIKTQLVQDRTLVLVIEALCAVLALTSQRGLPGDVFRHAFAGHLLQNGTDLRIEQELLGYADISISQFYTHLPDERMKARARDLRPLTGD